MGNDMSAILVGLAAVFIYVIGIFMGMWLGRSHPKKNTNNWSGAILDLGIAPPKPIIRPSPPGKE